MGEELPGGGRESQPTVLVSGATRQLLQEVPLGLLADRSSPGDGAVVVTTRTDPSTVTRRLASTVDALDADRLAVVDCCTSDQPQATVREGMRWSVRSSVAFGPAGRAIRTALSALAERGVERTHFLFDTLTTPFRLADGDDVLEYAQDVAMTIGRERGLGVFTVDRAAVTDREAERLTHLIDVHVEVRRGEDAPEVRWSGLVGGSNGWVGLCDASRTDAMGMNTG